MSKVISVLVLVSLLTFLVLPMVALAQDTCTLEEDLSDIHPDCTAGSEVDLDTYGMCCLVNSIYVVTKWLTFIIGGVVGLMIIAGAFMIVTAGGNPEKVTSGRNLILYAVIGMVVALFARAIPAIAKAILGIG
ncbi:hypothetical protein KJA15_01945 [Patescibacteria group bacterium]|nr:hypothetical protein [Patescibacteria group bacterium]